MHTATHAMLGEAITRLTDGDLKTRTGSHGLNCLEKLARDMFLNPAAAAKLSATARMPQIKIAVERAREINRPKDAIMAQLAKCKTLFADDAFFRNFPARLHPLFDWQPAREPIHPCEGMYLPLNRWGHPLGEGRDWDGDLKEYCDTDDAITNAWHFRWDDDTPDEAIYDIGYSHGLPLMDHYRDDHAPAFLATYASRLRRVLAEVHPTANVAEALQQGSGRRSIVTPAQHYWDFFGTNLRAPITGIPAPLCSAI
jgi:hypothetical protein